MDDNELFREVVAIFKRYTTTMKSLDEKGKVIHRSYSFTLGCKNEDFKKVEEAFRRVN